MKKYEALVADREGNAVVGAEVYIRDADTNSLLTLYSDNGVTTKTNPLTSDNDGYVFAYLADATLKVQVYIEGALESERSGIQHFDNLDNEIKALRSVTSAPDKGFYFTGSGTGAVYDLTSGGRALGGLASAADKLPYFTGSGTASTADFTAAGRALIDDANAAAQLTTLGVSAFAQTILDDADAATARATLGINSTNVKLTESFVIACSDETTALTTGVAKMTFRMPYAFTISAVRASLSTAQTSGSILTVDINEGGASILSTKLTIDNTEKTSTTAATAAVISDSSIADDAEITIDIDQVGDGTAKGLKVVLIGTRT